MGKYGKYLKKYSKAWEKETALKDWISANTEENVMNGQPEAFCKVCQAALRAHHTDLLKHAQTGKHIANAKKFDRRSQPSLHNYGTVQITEEVKYSEMKLAVFIAAHASIRSIDHLGEMLNELGEGSPLGKMRCHRTKCSKLIEWVIAPEFLQELLDDVGDSPYALIVDEVTDNSTSKFMGVVIRYYSQAKRRFVSDFLGLVHVKECTGVALATAMIEFLGLMKLPTKNLQSVGVDGAPNMCGMNNSFYTHLKARVPHLTLFKCVCHSIDKCAEHAFSKMPAELSDLIDQTVNWFAYSAKKWDEYTEYHMASTGKKPKKLVSRSKTRWLVWVPCSSMLLEQWYDLRGYFSMKGEGPRGDPKARDIAKLYSPENKLYLIFLRTVLSGVQKVSSAFEQTDADITKLYTDLCSQVLVLAGRILKPQAMAEVARPGMLRADELRVLKGALADPANLLPVDRVTLGEAFRKQAQADNLSEDVLNGIRLKCGEYIFTLTKLLLDKLPANLDAAGKLKFLTPSMALTRTARPSFRQLPTEMAGDEFDMDALESQWALLGTFTIQDIPGLKPEDTADTVDMVQFWGCLLVLKNAGGEQPFKELALFVLKCLTLPISNAVVERIFSVLSCIKCRRRNKLQLEMLEALIRLRVHLKVDSLCCKDFKPSRAMYRRFTADMYRRHTERSNRHPMPAPAPARPEEEIMNDDPDDPVPVLHLPEPEHLEEAVELQNIDFDIVNELDTVIFNEDLLVVRLNEVDDNE